MADRAIRYDFLGRDVSASRTADRVSRRFDGLSTRFGVFSRIGGRSLGLITTGLGALGVAGATMGIKTAAGLEQAEISFTTLLGSGRKARAFLGDLKSFAARTPFELPGLISSARQLIGVGQSAKSVIPTLRAWGDATGALGLSQEQFERAMLAVTQAMSKGKVQSEELLQITEAGIPVWPLLSKAMGKPVPELQKLASQGKLLATDVFPALERQMNKDFGGSMAKQSRTLNGLWSTFMDTLKLGLADAIKPFEDELKGGLRQATKIAGDALGKLPGFIRRISDTIDRLNLDELAGKLADFGGGAFEAAKDWAGRIIDGIREGLRTGDWSALGAAIGTGLRDLIGDGAALLRTAFAGVDWIKVGNQVGVGAASFAVGFVPALTDGLIDAAISHPLDFAKFLAAIIPAGKVAGILLRSFKFLEKIPILGFLLKALAKVGEPLFDAAGGVARAIGRGILKGIDDVFPGVGSRIGGALGLLGTRLGLGGLRLQEIAKKIPQGIGRGINAGLGFIGRAIGFAISRILKPFAPAGSWLVSRGQQVIAGLRAGIASRVGAAVAAVASIGGRVRGVFAGAGRWLFRAGANIIQGLIDGIRSRIGAIGDAIGEAAGKVRAFWPFSPAKEGPLSGRGDPLLAGRGIAQRIAEGIGDGTRLVAERTAGLAAAAQPRPSLEAARAAALAGATSPVGVPGMATATGGAVTFEIRSGGSRLDDLLVEVLRRSIRVRGGNVQVVLGTGA